MKKKNIRFIFILAFLVFSCASTDNNFEQKKYKDFNDLDAKEWSIFVYELSISEEIMFNENVDESKVLATHLKFLDDIYSLLKDNEIKISKNILNEENYTISLLVLYNIVGTGYAKTDINFYTPENELFTCISLNNEYEGWMAIHEATPIRGDREFAQYCVDKILEVMKGELEA